MRLFWCDGIVATFYGSVISGFSYASAKVKCYINTILKRSSQTKVVQLPVFKIYHFSKEFSCSPKSFFPKVSRVRRICSGYLVGWMEPVVKGQVPRPVLLFISLMLLIGARGGDLVKPSSWQVQHLAFFEGNLQSLILSLFFAKEWIKLFQLFFRQSRVHLTKISGLWLVVELLLLLLLLLLPLL